MLNYIFKDGDEFKNFVEQAKKDKKGRRLHALAQEQLTSYLSCLFPQDYATSEIGGVLGGRNDLMLFAFDGRKAVFEFFFSPSQVPQDLRLLEQANADIKIAILLDKEINPKLAHEYFHKKPNAFDYIWLSDLLIESQKERCLIELHEVLKLPSNIPNQEHSLFISHLPSARSKSIIANDLLDLSSALHSDRGEVIGGKYSSTCKNLKEANFRSFKTIQENSDAVPVSCTMDVTSLESTSISFPSKIKGNITVQY